MIKYFSLLLLYLFPALALAEQGSMSFAPPPGDYSVIFLGNLFGIVDGVLHGTGSQIMGAMFAVFNAAVLALGGIILMYTYMVSIMNTAHEGQMLGQKWSSMWIPVRSCAGLALLIPKASGYCLMQIFVMWLVVEGVGAADKVWDAALSYLNRGGVIIQAQMSLNNPTENLLPNSAMANVNQAAISMLSGQVCMLGLQKKLEAQRQLYMQQDSCTNTRPGNPLYGICSSAVPDFIGSVNAVAVQGANPSADKFSATMPNFDPNSPYSILNGICGTIAWNGISAFSNPVAPAGQNNEVSSSTCTKNCTSISLSSDEYQTGQMSRAIAIQQMYMDLQAVAQTIVANDPQISGSNVPAGTAPYSQVALQQFGVPYTSGNSICKIYNDKCTAWGQASATAGAGVLFNGTEVQGAIADYFGIMMPTNNLLSATQSGQEANDARAFINDASSVGWIMAGAYFFDLVKLNGNAAKNRNSMDSDSGLSASTSTPGEVGSACEQDSKYTILCTWFRNSTSQIQAVEALIDGVGTPIGRVGTPSPEGDPTRPVAIQATADSTVYGFLNNSLMVQLPGQPGLGKMSFGSLTWPTIDLSNLAMKKQKFGCGGIHVGAFKICLGKALGDIFYNTIFLNVYNILVGMFQLIMNKVIMSFLMLPLQGMSQIFIQNLNVLNAPGVNPIVALANMGVSYINFSADLWMMLTALSITAIVIPWFGVFMVALFSMIMPLVIAWLGVMTSIGFVTAYYVPLLPYMMFLFGAVAWLICVIEAMVAAPIVALGVTHPEGHESFGKGEAAIMLLLNVFLRPAMMIIGYIAAISLSYVGVWVLNAGFGHAVSFYQADKGGSSIFSNVGSVNIPSANKPNVSVETPGQAKAGANNALVQIGGGAYAIGQKSTYTNVIGNSSTYTNMLPGLQNVGNKTLGGLKDAYGVLKPHHVKQESSGTGETKYTGWAGVYAFFFAILMYTSLYLVLVQQAFTLVTVLPDKILRWIGGTPENIGQESSGWGKELKGEAQGAGKEAQGAVTGMGKQMTGGAIKGVEGAKAFLGGAKGGEGEASAKGGDKGGGGGE